MSEGRSPDRPPSKRRSARGKADEPPSTVETIARECLAVRLRMLNRRLTRVYDEALRPHGLSVAQLNMLVAIAFTGHISPTALGEALDLEKSTLSRNVKRLVDQGWVRVWAAVEGRGQLLGITDEGRALIEQVEPAWARAQEQARVLLGESLGGELGRVRMRGS